MGAKGVIFTLVTFFEIVFSLQSENKYSGKAPFHLLSDGNMMPVVAIGTARGTNLRVDKKEVLFSVYWAISVGYRHIDTTASYADEREVGKGIAAAISENHARRQDLYITTKLPNHMHRQKQVIRSLKRSLKRLELDYVDLYLIHWPISYTNDGRALNIDYLETWSGMEQAKEMNLTRSIGVANFNAEQLDRLLTHAKIKPVVNQIEVNPTLTQEALVKHCQKNKVVVMAYCPFGFLVKKNWGEAPPPFPYDPTLVGIARKYGKSISQVVLRYLLDRDLVVIPKTVNKINIEQNIDVFDFHLTNDEVRTIGEFNKNIRVNEPIAWQEFPNYPFERREIKTGGSFIRDPPYFAVWRGPESVKNENKD